MRKSAKILAIILALATVVCTFCATLSASAENENILKGLPYTVETDMSIISDATADNDNTFLTDGAYRGDGTNEWDYGAIARPNVTKELFYGSRSASVVFAFDGAKNISTIIIRGTREVLEAGYTCNRCTGIQSIQVTTDGSNYNEAAYEVKYVACAGAPEMANFDQSATASQFYDIYVTVVGAAGVTGLKVNLNATNPKDGPSGDIMQLDEIEAYAETVAVPEISEETSDETSEAEETSEADETSEAPKPPVTDNGNILKGMSYTVETDMYTISDATADTDNTFLTDGAYRGDGTNDWDGNVALAGVTRESAGTGKHAAFTFTFDSPKSISTIIIRGTREIFEEGFICNRNTVVEAVQVTTDGDVYSYAAFETKYVACEGAPEAQSDDKSSTATQFYDIYVTVVGASNITGLKVILTDDTCYVMQLDEIEAYAETVAAPEISEETSEETSDGTSEETSDETSEETSEPVTPPTITDHPADITYKVTAVEDAKGLVTVTVTTPYNREDVNSGKVVICVSDKLTLIDVDASGINGTVNRNYSAKDYAGNTVNGVCVAFAKPGSFAPSTVVAVLTYQKAPGAELTDADITVPEWNVSSVNGNKLGQTGWVFKIGVETYVDGGLADITVTPFTVILGDVNGDGLVDNMDAALILRYDAGITTELNHNQYTAANVNGDGLVDNMDVALILRYDAKIITKFPV